jgi:hypothetical protein
VGELGDLFELMHGARGSWRTVRLTVRDWGHTARSKVAFERWRATFEAGGGATSGLMAYAPGRAEPPPETHEHATRIWIDGERGIVLGFTAFVDGEPYHVREIVEIAFDETFPDETFRVELPPGESFELAGGRPPQHLTLDQAVQKASFALFVPARPGPGWELADASYCAASERPMTGESVFLSYRFETGTRQFQLVETTEPHPWLGGDEPRTIERDGYVMKALDPREADFPMPRHVLVERDGTHVNLSSQDLSLDELIELAVTLVSVHDSPPPAVER